MPKNIIKHSSFQALSNKYNCEHLILKLIVVKFISFLQYLRHLEINKT